MGEERELCSRGGGGQDEEGELCSRGGEGEWGRAGEGKPHSGGEG